MPHLVALAPRGKPESDGFPFNVPAIATLPRMDLVAPVTFFAGENGSGKSTLLEAIAVAANLPTVGSDAVSNDVTLASQRKLAKHLKLTWHARTPRGFFLRAEDFFGFAKRLSEMRSEFQQRLTEIDEEYHDRSAYAKGLAQMPARTSLAEMERRYGVDLDANSHGQSFLKLFQSRLVPGGLYLLDEPEAPLSPQSQLAMLTMIAELVEKNAQFIIATHSPILLAYPGAAIYSFDQTPIGAVGYSDLEHVNLTREFLNAPDRYLRHLVGKQREDE